MDDLDNGSHIREFDDSGDGDGLPEAYKHIYGTDNYEWNNYKRPNDSDIYEFSEKKNFFCLIFKNLFLYLVRTIRQFLDFLIWRNLLFLQTA